MTYNMTDEEWAALSKEQLLELCDASAEFARRLNEELSARGLMAVRGAYRWKGPGLPPSGVDGGEV